MALSNETWKRGTLDDPSADLNRIRMVGPRSQSEAQKIADRVAIERNNGVTPNDSNSLLSGADPRSPIMRGQAIDSPAVPDLANPQPPAFRGGSAAFESTMDALSDRQARMEGDEQLFRDTGSALIAGQRANNEARAKNNATPGAEYRTANPDVALSDSERAAGASARVSTPGKPGQYGVNALPQGFTSYQNKDGTWTLLDKNNNRRVFKNEAEVSAYFNEQPAAPAAAGPNIPSMANAPMMPARASGVIPGANQPSVDNPAPPPPAPAPATPTAARYGIDPGAAMGAAAGRDASKFYGMYGMGKRPEAPAPSQAPAAQPSRFPMPAAATAALDRLGTMMLPQSGAPAPAAIPQVAPTGVPGPEAMARAQSNKAMALDIVSNVPPLNLRPPTKKPVERQAEAVAERFNPFKRRTFTY